MQTKTLQRGKLSRKDTKTTLLDELKQAFEDITHGRIRDWKEIDQ
jgi:hypothetical protein